MEEIIDRENIEGFYLDNHGYLYYVSKADKEEITRESLALANIDFEGSKYNIYAEPVSILGTSRKKKSITFIDGKLEIELK